MRRYSLLMPFPPKNLIATCSKDAEMMNYTVESQSLNSPISVHAVFNEIAYD